MLFTLHQAAIVYNQLDGDELALMQSRLRYTSIVMNILRQVYNKALTGVIR